MSLFRWFILRSLRGDLPRTAVTIAGVAVGIAVVIAIRLANASSVLGFETALNAMSGRTSLEIAGAGSGVDEALLAELGWLREYGLVSPVIEGDVLLDPRGAAGAGAELVRLLGVDILRDRPFRDYPLVGGADAESLTTRRLLALLTDPQAVVVTAELARRRGLDVDSAVDLIGGDRRVGLIVRGLLGREGPAEVQDGNFILMDIAAAQLALDRLGRVDRVDVRLAEGLDVAAVEQAIAARLPPGLTVQRPERRGAQVEKMLAAFHFNLAALSYIALLVGMFLVYNTVSVTVITRRAEIGMLRTVGTPRRAVMALFLGEAAALALVGCALGTPLGWLLAQAAVRMTASTVTTFWVASAAQVPPLAPEDVGLAVAVGLSLALAAAIVPAREAARLTPVGALRDEDGLSPAGGFPGRHVAGAGLLLAVAAWCATRPAVAGLPVFGLLAALAIVFAAALLVPPTLYLLQRARGPRRWLRVESELARTNLGGAIRRVSISVAALAVSLAMMVAIAIMIGSFRETVAYWVGQTLQADLFVAAGRGSPVGARATVSADVEAALRAHESVLAVDGFRSVDLPYRDSLIVVGAGRFDVMLAHGNLLFKEPADGRSALAAALGRPAVVVSESFALRFDAAAGDDITLQTARGEQAFRVTGVYYDYSTDRGLVVMDHRTFATYYGDGRPSGLTAYLAAGADPGRVRQEVLAALGPGRPVFINTNASLRRSVMRVFDSTFAITYALEAIAICVSLFGVAATLLTLALERRRQIAMLRLLGAERSHLRRMIVIEAVVLGMVSLGIGLVVGFLLSLILIYVINVQSFGWTIQYHVPLGFLLRAAALVVAGAALAGLYPARLAGRFHLAERGADA